MLRLVAVVVNLSPAAAEFTPAPRGDAHEPIEPGGLALRPGRADGLDWHE
jgi:hypothetical protein